MNLAVHAFFDLRRRLFACWVTGRLQSPAILDPLEAFLPPRALVSARLPVTGVAPAEVKLIADFWLTPDITEPILFLMSSSSSIAWLMSSLSAFLALPSLEILELANEDSLWLGDTKALVVELEPVFRIFALVAPRLSVGITLPPFLLPNSLLWKSESEQAYHSPWNLFCLLRSWKLPGYLE